MQLDEALGLIRVIPDFPTPGIAFQDITPLLGSAEGFGAVVRAMVPWTDGADVVVGIEARGFILGAALAQAAGLGFVPVRKRGKLPGDVVTEAYSLEYGSAEIEIRSDAVRPGQRVVMIDDVLATGGTAEAACRLVERLGGVIGSIGVLLELGALGGRERLPGRDVQALHVV